MRPHALHPGAIQGKVGIKFCHLATLPARPLRRAGVEPPRQRLDALLLGAALLVVAAPPRHGLARAVVGKVPAEDAVVAPAPSPAVAVVADAAVLVAAAVERGRVAPLAADVEGQGAQALLVFPAVVVPLALGARADAGLEVVIRRLQALLARVAVL